MNGEQKLFENLFDFTEADLLENKRGNISEHQRFLIGNNIRGAKRKALRMILTWSAVSGLSIGYILATLNVPEFMNGVAWVLMTIFIFGAAVRRYLPETRELEKLTFGMVEGAPTHDYFRNPIDRQRYLVCIKDTRLWVADEKQQKAFKPLTFYRVYYVSSHWWTRILSVQVGPGSS